MINEQQEKINLIRNSVIETMGFVDYDLVDEIVESVIKMNPYLVADEEEKHIVKYDDAGRVIYELDNDGEEYYIDYDEYGRVIHTYGNDKGEPKKPIFSYTYKNNLVYEYNHHEDETNTYVK